MSGMEFFGWDSWTSGQGYDTGSGDGGAGNHQQAMFFKVQ